MTSVHLCIKRISCSNQILCSNNHYAIAIQNPEPLSQLPGSEREVKEVAALLQTKAIIGKDATKVAIAKQLPVASIIHIASHGLLDDIHGWGSSIALAPSGVDNGLLSSEEILDLKLNAELVVLSACDTARGRINADGVDGLSRSFITAGVSSIVVTLWAIPDQPTVYLMTEFYRNLQRNPDRAQALRQAILATKKRHPEPKNWAAFTLIGEAQL